MLVLLCLLLVVGLVIYLKMVGIENTWYFISLENGWLIGILPVPCQQIKVVFNVYQNFKTFHLGFLANHP
jgi:hypothetical protein